MKNKFVEVVLPLPVEKTFSYSVPESLSGMVKKGVRVKVPFRNRRLTGFVIKVTKRPAVPRTKPIDAVVDSESFIDDKMFKLAQKIGADYLSNQGEILKFFLPGNLKVEKEINSGVAALTPLEKANSSLTVLTLTQKENRKDFPMLENENKLPPDFWQLSKGMAAKAVTGKFSLNGISGLSVTERQFFYLDSIKKILAGGISCLLLVPEISFIKPLEEFFSFHLPQEKVFSFHSRLKTREKSAAWFWARQGKGLFIGTQQAVFLPFGKIGLIIVEEEGEIAYKQRTAPRLNIRDVAVERAKIEKCFVILAGTVLSLDSFYKIKKSKEAQYLDLSNFREKINAKLIDLNRQSNKPFFISKEAEFKILKCLEEKKKIFVFLNRKGFSTYVTCQSCGYLKRCPNCGLPLVYYYAQKELVCNFCLYRESSISLCPECRKGYFKFGGAGIEKVESELARIFPQARIEALSAEKANSSHFYQVIKKYEEGQIDILIATQVLAKRPHQAKAELVLLAMADMAFNIPDFRAGERIFALMAQMKNLVKPGGDFIIQTFVPDAAAVKYAASDNVDIFYKEELETRRKLNLPPVAAFIQLRVSSLKEQYAKKTAVALDEFLKEKAIEGINISSHAPCFHSKLKGRYRWQITIAARDKKKLFLLAGKIKENFKAPNGVRLTFDVEPQEVL